MRSKTVFGAADRPGRRALRGGVGAAALLGLAIGCAPAAFAAQAAAQPPAHTPKPKQAAPEPDDDDDGTEVSGVTVSASGERPLPGAVIGDIKPELQLNPADIQSYGVSTVTELLNELAPQTQSDRGRGGEAPVVLLNGRPISGMNEIRNIPTEAILRVDILPEEVALKYGYTANQRVVNIVLRRFFRAVTGEGQAYAPTEGGQFNDEVEVDQFSVRRDNRMNLDLKYSSSTMLTEDERDLAPLTDDRRPYDLLGNVVATPPGTAIPALSALVGRPVTIAGVPSVAGTRTLALSDFTQTADVANVSDIGRYRTLSPATQEVAANGVLSRAMLGGSATVNASLGATTSRALQGLPGVGLAVPASDPFSPFGSPVTVDRYLGTFGPLRQDTDGWTGHLGLAFNRDFGKWRFSFTSNYDHSDSLTLSDRSVDVTALQTLLTAASPSLDPFGPLPAGFLGRLVRDKARSVQDSGSARMLLTGSLFKLPAGAVTTSLKISDSESGFSTRSERTGLVQSLSLSRNVFNGQINLDLPIASKKNHVLGFLGELSVNANTALDHVSGFGNLQVLGYGLNWTPVAGLNLIVSHTRDQQAPTVQQLGGPVLVTPNARLFDYLTGQTVDVNKITGGAASLLADHRDVLKIGLTWKPFKDQDLTFSANYIASKIRNPIATFPAATAEIEAAFPDRFLRDAEGDLVEVDYRPLNFAEQNRKELRWGLNFTHRIGKPPPTREQRRAAFEALRAAGVFQGRRGGRRGGTDANGANGATPPPPSGAAAAPAPRTAGAPPAGAAGAASTGSDGAAEPGRRGGRDGGDGGRRGGFGRGRGFGGGPGAQGGQVQFAIYHTVYFDDHILVRPGGPLLDLLDGSAVGAGGGQPRHQIQAQAGVTLNGWGARMAASWQAATTVDAGPASPTGNLTFGSFAIVNLRLFANLGGMPKLVEHRPWLRGTRLTLSVNNLFDTREQVRDAAGATPLSYQGAYLDPEGRTIHLSFRKLFF